MEKVARQKKRDATLTNGHFVAIDTITGDILSSLQINDLFQTLKVFFHLFTSSLEASFTLLLLFPYIRLTLRYFFSPGQPYSLYRVSQKYVLKICERVPGQKGRTNVHMNIWSQMLCCQDNGHKSAVSNNALFERLQFCYCCL